MAKEKSILFLEYKKITNNWNLIILLTMFFLSLLMAQLNMNNFNSDSKSLKNSGEIEIKKVSHFRKWSCYGAFGVILTTVPSQMNFLSSFRRQL